MVKKKKNMRYDFDEIIERKGTSCVKHDALIQNFGRDDLLPMWVADMDWRSPDFVMEAIRQRCQHEVLGYAVPSQSYWDTMQDWLQRRYHIQAPRETLHYIPGIVAGIAFAIQAFTQPGDKILVMNPVYPPFLHLPQGSRRPLSCSPLRVEGGRFIIDFDDLRHRAQGCRMMILSNPHNPGGTVWSPEELRQIAEICHQNNLIVIADEIHADLTLPGHQHTSYSTVSPQAKDHSITFIAPSKTFNIAGLGSSISHTPNPQLRATLHGYLDTFEVANGNIFAYVGAEAAFRHGEEWLRQCLDYIQGNVDLLAAWVAQHPMIQAVLPQASYLAWLDLSAYGISHSDLKSRLINEAKVALNDGTDFGGSDYECRFRINLGCPRAILTEALTRINRIL